MIVPVVLGYMLRRWNEKQIVDYGWKKHYNNFEQYVKESTIRKWIHVEKSNFMIKSRNSSGILFDYVNCRFCLDTMMWIKEPVPANANLEMLKLVSRTWNRIHSLIILLLLGTIVVFLAEKLYNGWGLNLGTMSPRQHCQPSPPLLPQISNGPSLSPTR